MLDNDARIRPFRFRGYADDLAGDVTVFVKSVDADDSEYQRLGVIERQHVNGTSTVEVARMLGVENLSGAELGSLAGELHWPRRW